SLTLHPECLPIPAKTTLAELPEYVISKYALADRRLRCWNLREGVDRKFKEHARCVLLLALVCLSFDCTVVAPEELREFLDTMESIIDSAGYRNHSDRLGRLTNN
ncbi:hypothetical protein GGI10_004469, partial [Coemansia sp. RSA 2530]